MEGLKVGDTFHGKHSLQDEGEDEEVLSNVGVERLEAKDMFWKKHIQLSFEVFVEIKFLSLTGSSL